MKISYNWLTSYVPDIPEPNRLADLFTYHICEVESVEKLPNGDFLFDLGILPNRAHDLLSHQGVARELAGLLGIQYKDPTVLYKTPASAPTQLAVEIKTEKCRRYSARIIRNVKVGPSPEWVVTHLESIGQRSINNIVDATNIVMHDCGQPTHAFDLKKITNYELQITNAKEGEELKLVGREGIVAKLKDSDMVISSGGKTLALAGVKGGFDSGVVDDTTDILIEVANFDPVSVRKTARRLGLLTDSAKRFENDLSATLCDFGMLELSALLVEVFPDAVFEDIIDIYPAKEEKRTLSFSSAQIQKRLGIKISAEDIKKILTDYRYDFTTSEDKISGPRVNSPDAEILSPDSVKFSMTVPPLRLDLTGSHDMAEEIGRVYGYDKIIPQLPEIDFIPKQNEKYLKIIEVRNQLLSEGYREVMTYAFANTGDIEVLASASDKRFLRTNLTDGIKKSYELNKLNAPLLNDPETKIFEIGTVFKNGGESVHVAYANKKEIKEMKIDDFIAPSSDDFSGPRVGSPDHEKSSEDSAYSDSIFKAFKPWSMYPFIVRDIAVWVPEGTLPETLAEIYKEFGAEILRGDPVLFDQFTKDGRTSYGFRLVFQAFDRTLTDDEVNGIMGTITEKISSLGWSVR
ncbi:MAG: phenylalanine--tRNA ligase subunit beta [Patescibacteria group bacterium]